MESCLWVAHSKEFGNTVHCSILGERTPLCHTWFTLWIQALRAMESLALTYKLITWLIIFNMLLGHCPTTPKFASLNTGIMGKRKRRKWILLIVFNCNNWHVFNNHQLYNSHHNQAIFLPIILIWHCCKNLRQYYSVERAWALELHM